MHNRHHVKNNIHDEFMKNLTFQEKTLWVSLFAEVFVYGLYYLNVLPPVNGNMESPHIWQYFKYIGLLIVVIIVGVVAIALKDRSEVVDERQKLIEMKADRVSAYILHFGIFVAIVVAMFVPGNFWFIHTLTVIGVLADIVNKVLQLRSFSRGY
jgi:H+/Cl- antiporter ClcA